MRVDRSKLAPYSYLLGLFALLFGAGWLLLNRRPDTPFQIAIGLTLAFIAAGILLDPDRVRSAFATRQARYGSNAVLLTLSFAGILGVANYFAAQTTTSWDLTEDQQYSLAPETRELISDLEEPVQIIGFYTPNQARTRDNVEPLLERYEAVSRGDITHRFVDPNRDPVEAQRFGVTRDASLVVVQEDRSEVLSAAQEREITGAILRVTQPGQRAVYFLIGHGERDLDDGGGTGYSRVRQALESKNYRVEELNLAAEQDVPTGADVLVIAAPRRALSDPEIEALAAYQSQGGAVMVLLEPPLEEGPGGNGAGLLTYLENSWAVLARPDIVVDEGSTVRFVPVAASYGDHPITERMGTLGSYFPTSRSLALPELEATDLPRRTGLVLTGRASWGETQLEGINDNSPVFDEGEDAVGPMILAAAARDPGTEARLVAFGDSDFATNDQILGFGNRDLIINAVDWLAGQEELIQLTPRERTNRTVVTPSVQTVGLVFCVSVILVPGAAVAAGAFAWWQRRQRS